ncbi:nicotinate-nucleotide adenylyltransferase [Anaerosacchariphilus polymeriproducens]|uniref:Probable nicotinate-nucleotide adenylyltransferase n=1 Tax=Anaerosacchariphilus polymeriproducens TaxID=1812858 RepID=A0A371AUC5_9FIRM|nr:nicotinate-nucleotide adenylyltransferase [Anaerosacchariphilus polymeriproducens]
MEKFSKKVGIMGGSFDPIHIGHLILAESAYEQFDLEQVLFIPTGNPPHKDISIFSTSKQRLEMVSLAIQDNSHFQLSTLEMEREGVIYTFRTLEIIKNQNPDTDYYFIMGADSLFDFESWKEPSKITEYCTLLVATRENMENQALKDKILYLKNKYKSRIQILNTPNIDISSRSVRESVKNGSTIKYFVPKEVETYIKKNHLYLYKE